MKLFFRGICFVVLALTIILWEVALPQAGAAKAGLPMDSRISNSIALLIGSPHALVGNKQMEMDTRPFIQNNSALVPIRFISENLGASVKWNDNDRSVALSFGSKSVLLKINSDTMDVNGAKVQLETPAIILQGSTFLPLRAVSEALGMNVFYEKGLVVVGEKKDELDSNKDQDLIAGLIDRLTFHELKLSMLTDPYTLDSTYAESSNSLTIINAINEGLYRLDPKNHVTPALAKELPKISADGLTYSIVLRDGLKWSDGSPLTAEDFVYAIPRITDPANESPYQFMAQWIDQIEAKDSHTLEIKLLSPRTYLTQMLAFPIFFPQKKSYVEASGETYGENQDKIIGAGPFILSEWEHNGTLTLIKNKNYWDSDHIQLDQVTIHIVNNWDAGISMYNSGETDLVAIGNTWLDEYKNSPDFYEKKESTTSYISFQEQQVPAFANVKIRNALEMAIDRETLASNILHNGSIASSGLVPWSILGNDGEYRQKTGNVEPEFNPELAKQLLAEGLQELGLTSLPRFELLSDNTGLGKEVNAFIVNCWKTYLGVEANSNPVQHSVRIEKESNRNFDATISLWGADYNDPMTFLDMFTTNNEFNSAGYSNKAYDDLIEKANGESNTAKRYEYLVESEKKLMEDMVVAPLYYRSHNYLKNPKVQNLLLPGFEVEWEIRWAKIVK